MESHSSDNIKGHTFRNSRAHKNEKATTIITALKQVINSYQARGFKICHILGNGQFEHSRKHVEHMGIILNITSQDEHVPDLERCIRTVKEICG